VPSEGGVVNKKNAGHMMGSSGGICKPEASQRAWALAARPPLRRSVRSDHTLHTMENVRLSITSALLLLPSNPLGGEHRPGGFANDSLPSSPSRAQPVSG
jgi:hypothetical protein